MTMRIRFLGALAVTTGVALSLVPPSGGASLDPVWTCRASTGYLLFPGQHQRLEPVVANGGTTEADPSETPPEPGNIDRADCNDDAAGFPEITAGGEPGDPGSLTLRGPFAETAIDPDKGPVSQTISSQAGVDRLRITNSTGTMVLTADVANATGSGSCQNGSPVFGTQSKVVNLVLNGTPIPVDDAIVPIANGINASGLAAILQIEVNKDEPASAAADQPRTRRALRIKLFSGDGMMTGAQPDLVAVVGEVKVGATGNPCVPVQCPAGTTETQRNADGTIVCQQVVREQAPCPEGSQPDPGGACVRTIVVQAPREAALPPCPAGQVRDIRGICREEPRSRCVRGRFGNPLLGTNRADRITGTNRADRILSLGGRDKVSGGRGNDCLEGGSGNDNLDGSNNNDLLFGGTGRDILNGGTGRDRLRGESGNDKLTGGSGNDSMFGGRGRDRLSGGFGRDLLDGGPGKDYIDDGNGADRIRGGPGNDAINVATAGKGRDTVDCGPGRDTVRVNNRDRVRNCEIVLVTRRR